MVDKVIAKFRRLSVDPAFTEDNIDVRFEAVYGDGKENKEWSKWTPSGLLTVNISNPKLMGHFQVDKEYYLGII